MLWINGLAGCGKTILASWLISYLSKSLQVPLAYCFSSTVAQNLQQADEVVRTWLLSLMRSDGAIFDLCYRRRLANKAKKASGEVVWELMRDVLIQAKGSILIMDGLNEFSVVDSNRKRFVQRLRRVLAVTQTRILITSRTESDIEMEMAFLHRDQLYECSITKDQTRDDIVRLSRSMIDERLPTRASLFGQELAKELALRCDGMFLWIKLQRERLSSAKSDRVLRETILSMPRGLHLTYSRVWQNICAAGNERVDGAINILRWVTFSYRPLTVQELTEALFIDANHKEFCDDDMPPKIDDDYINTEIKDPCGSLLEIREPSEFASPPNLRTVHVVH